MKAEVERTRFRVRLTRWVLLNGGLVLVVVLPVSVVVVARLLHSHTPSQDARAAATKGNGSHEADRGRPPVGAKPSAQEVAQELRTLALAAESATPAGPLPSIAASAGASPVLPPAPNPPTGGQTQAPNEPPVTTAVPTTAPQGHRPPPPPPPPTTAPSPPPTTEPVTVPMTATAWSAAYGSTVGRLSAEVTNVAYYSGAGSDFSQFAANVASAERFPPIPDTGAFASLAGSAWQQALAKLSALVSDGELCLKGATRDCHEKRLSSSAASSLSYARADLQRAVALGE